MTLGRVLGYLLSHPMNAASLVLVPGLRGFRRVTEEDDIQGDLLFRQPQNGGNLTLGPLLGVDASPDRPQAKLRGLQQNVFRCRAAILDPVFR